MDSYKVIGHHILRYGIFPGKWKIAAIVLFPKVQATETANDYSLTPCYLLTKKNAKTFWKLEIENLQ